jgi:hypothetical protein
MKFRRLVGHILLGISDTKLWSHKYLPGSLSGLRLTVDVCAIHYDTQLPGVGGSAIARELLVQTMDNSDSFSVESANRSADVAFAQIESTMNYSDGINPRHNEWVIRIDFADFAQLRGDAIAVKALNPGMNMMHELRTQSSNCLIRKDQMIS